MYNNIGKTLLKHITIQQFVDLFSQIFAHFTPPSVNIPGKVPAEIVDNICIKSKFQNEKISLALKRSPSEMWHIRPTSQQNENIFVSKLF